MYWQVRNWEEMKWEETKYQFNIYEEQKGIRIDLVLSLALADTSRSFIQKLFDAGSVKVNDAVCLSKKYKVAEGDRVEINLPKPAELKIEAENIPIDIVYEDDHVLIVNKPKGMVVHPASGNYTGTLVNAIMFHCGHRLSSINGVIRPGIVHRIDKDTSGLLMIAKNDAAHEALSRQLENHSIVRKYQALVFNNIKTDRGTVKQPLGRDPKNRLKRAVDGLGAKTAITHYKVIERFGSHTLIEAQLETGRTHQIRVHMAWIKHPLVGDLVYGPKRQSMVTTGQMLHAKTIGFIHPATGKYMEFDSELPEYFTQVLEKLRREQQ